MTTKVGLSVTYGIGVQNRYSAFLDDDDGFGGPILVTNVTTGHGAEGRQMEHIVGSTKQQKQLNSKSGASKTSARTGTSSATTSGSKIDTTSYNKNALPNNQKQQQARGASGTDSNKRHQQIRSIGQAQSGANISSTSRQAHNFKQPSNQDGTVANNNNTNNKFVRNQSHNNQFTANHQSQNKENNESTNGHHGNRPSNRSNNYVGHNNLRTNNKYRHHGERNHEANGQQTNGGANSTVTGNASFGAQSVEEEKHRRQQKRVIDLKHKDFGKKETRRQQNVESTQPNAEDSGEPAQGDNQYGPRGYRNKREGNKNQDDQTRDSKGGQRGGGRVRRLDGDDRRRQDGRAGPRDVERARLNRNGVGSGSRSSRNSQSESKNQERQKPIPNLSDKSDFPSLAS